MQSELEQLLSKVRTLVQPRGAKARLARYLDVAAPRVSEWLRGDWKPSGETTLKLLHWVEQQESQQTKAPAVLAIPPEPKTHPRKFTYEKAKADRPRR
jgi:predicted XRE-type DNA-binding protein